MTDSQTDSKTADELTLNDDCCVHTEADALLCTSCFREGSEEFPGDNNPCYWAHAYLPWIEDRHCFDCGYAGPDKPRVERGKRGERHL